jgi:hypothetical protein
MEKFDERRAAEALRHFDAVWKRVGAARSAQSQADRCGVVLMPRRQYKKPEREGNPRLTGGRFVL